MEKKTFIVISVIGLFCSTTLAQTAPIEQSQSQQSQPPSIAGPEPAAPQDLSQARDPRL
jgi:hypothetical protein